VTVGATATHRSWVREASGDVAVAALDATWTEFAVGTKPVVTLFGAYDTGKSSIVRRLLVDSGEPIPEWLTVSARHETFEPHDVEVRGCVVRDTPGLSPDGEDARSQNNSSAARTTLGVTDILVVTLNPQLSTGERPELLEILGWNWPTGSVWFAISRADEGGPDPMSDPEGFEAWAERKREELVDSLGSTGTRPVFVVVPDYAGLEDPSLWEASRPWDGMDLLQAALDGLAKVDVAPLREAAMTRFWSQAVRSRLVEVREGLEDLTTSHSAATASCRRRQIFLKQLDGLVSAAQTALEGAVEDGVHRILNNTATDQRAIEAAIDPVLEVWWLSQQTALTRIRKNAIEAIEVQEGTRGWKKLEDVYRAASSRSDDAIASGWKLTPFVIDSVRRLQSSANSLDDLWRAHQATRSPGRAKELLDGSNTLKEKLAWNEKLTLATGIADAVLPLLTMATDFVDDRLEAKRALEERERVRSEVTQIAKEAAARAMEGFMPDVELLRAEIAAHTAGREVVDLLSEDVARVIDLISQGEALLGDREKPRTRDLLPG
jgi:hypothetical protein